MPMLFYCDLHGHSKSKNVFMYGNTSEENPEDYKVFPYIMEKMCPYFSFKSSWYIHLCIKVIVLSFKNQSNPLQELLCGKN